MMYTKIGIRELEGNIEILCNELNFVPPENGMKTDYWVMLMIVQILEKIKDLSVKGSDFND